MIVAARNCDDAAEVWNRLRSRIGAEVGALSQLAGAVVTPRPDAAVIRNCEHKLIACRDVGNRGGESGDFDRIRMRREVVAAASWSKSAGAVVAPGPDSAVVLERDAKVT